jgi:DNA repair protein RadD
VTGQGALWTPDRPPPVLRSYQVAAVEAVFDAWRGGRRAPLLVLPTGAGKTIILVEIIRLVVEAVATPACVLVLVPRRELVGQTVEKLAAVGIAPGVICAAMDPEAGLAAPVQVASVDTLHSRVQRRASRRTTLDLAPPRLVVVDEAHLSITKRKVELIAGLGPERLLGLTATPTRKDGRALGMLFDELLDSASVASLTADGFLVRARSWSWPTPDLGSVRIDSKTKDYRLDDLATVVNRPKLLGDIVAHWLKLAGDRRTVGFTVDIKHAIALAEAFRAVGVPAEALSAQTPMPERAALLARFRTGELQVVCNCFVLAYGFDLPEIGCVILARPTKSLMLYLQMTGRALRPAPGKIDCLVLDHAGAVHRHGFIADERRWTLDGTTALVENATRARDPKPAKVCPNCDAIFTESPSCPECGYVLRPQGRMVPTLDGELVELGAGDDPDLLDRRAFYAELRGLQAQRAYKPKFAKANYLERFKTWPSWSWEHDPIVAPSLATVRWVQSRQIAWRKAQGGAGR